MSLPWVMRIFFKRSCHCYVVLDRIYLLIIHINAMVTLVQLPGLFGSLRMRLVHAAETVFHGWHNLVPRARVRFRPVAASRPFCFLSADQTERSVKEQDCSCYCPGDPTLRMRKVVAIPLRCVVFRFQIFLFMHYFKSLLQKEITIHHKSNIKTTLNYINIKGRMCAVSKGA